MCRKRTLDQQLVPLLLRVRNSHRYTGFSRSRGDRTVFVYTKIEVPERAADLVCGATAAEDRSAEIIFEDIARPVLPFPPE